MIEHPLDDPEQLVLEIYCQDVARSVDFYGALGFEVRLQRDDFAILRWGSRQIYLAKHDELPPTPNIPRANFCLIVPDVESVWEQAQAMDAEIFDPIDDRPYGLRDFIMLDPSGFGVRVAERLRPYDPSKDAD